MVTQYPSSDKLDEFIEAERANGNFSGDVRYEHEVDSPWWGFLINIGPMLLLVFFWIFIMRRMSGGGSSGGEGALPYLNDIDINFVCVFFNLKREELRCCTRRQSIQKHWNF